MVIVGNTRPAPRKRRRLGWLWEESQRARRDDDLARTVRALRILSHFDRARAYPAEQEIVVVQSIRRARRRGRGLDVEPWDPAKLDRVIPGSTSELWSRIVEDDPLERIVDPRDGAEERFSDVWAQAIRDETDALKVETTTRKLERRWLARPWAELAGI